MTIKPAFSSDFRYFLPKSIFFGIFVCIFIGIPQMSYAAEASDVIASVAKPSVPQAVSESISASMDNRQPRLLKHPGDVQDGKSRPSALIGSDIPLPSFISKIQTNNFSTQSNISISSVPAGSVLNNQAPVFNSSVPFYAPQFGSTVQNFSIEVVPGVQGIQPNINVTYSSNYGTGLFGVGWSFDLGSISRSLKKGTPKYTDNDVFQAGGKELAFDSNEQYYRARIEEDFTKYEKNTNTWLVTTRDGTKLFFGQTINSRIESNGNVFQWLIDRVEDVHGNYMIFEYEQIGTQRYPKYIRYTANDAAGLSAFAEVAFILEDRETSHQTYTSGFLVKTDKRIKEIIAKADGVPQRYFKFGYDTSSITQRDLLTSFQKFGSDNTTNTPPIVFSYYEDKGFEYQPNAQQLNTLPFANNINGEDVDNGIRLVDLNADAYPDFLYYFVEQKDIFFNEQIFRTTLLYDKTDGEWIPEQDFDFPQLPCQNKPPFDIGCVAFIAQKNFGTGLFNTDLGARISDVNGDGRNDIIVSLKIVKHYILENNSYDTPSIQYINKVYINTESGFIEDSQWSFPTGEALFGLFQHYLRIPSVGNELQYFRSTHLGNYLVDVNNDGYVDLVTAHRLEDNATTGDLTRTFNVYLNNMASGQPGWTLAPGWQVPGGSNTQYTNFLAGATLVDLNGDQLPDIFYHNGSTIKVFINNGNNWQEETASPWNNTLGYGNLTDGSTQFADINGDRLVDMVIAKGSISAGSHTLINTGDGWVQDDSYALPEGDFRNLGTRLVDYNADTLTDFIINYNGASSKTYKNIGQPADILKSIDNSYGGETTYNYVTSAFFEQNFMPFAVPTVFLITKSNSLGDSYDTEFSYANGFWDWQERDFRGYELTETRHPEGHVTQQRFYLTNYYLKGRPFSVSQYNSLSDVTSGNPLTKKITAWTSAPILDNSNFVSLSQEENFTYNPSNGTEDRLTFQDFYYDDYGNLTLNRNFGEVTINASSQISDIGGDNDFRQTAIAYSQNLSKHILGIPHIVSIYNHPNVNELIRNTNFFYDNNNLDNQLGSNPEKGLLTRIKSFSGLDTVDQKPDVIMTYNNLGNLLTTSDPNRHVSTITYDSTYGIFPIREENVVDGTTLAVNTHYYDVNELSLSGHSGLWGQVQAVTDPNNNRTSSTYDALGRVKTTVSPKDTIALPSTSVDYIYDLSNKFYIETAFQRIRHGDSKTLDSSVIYDGLNRPVLKVSDSDQPGGIRVLEHTLYDSRGLPIKSYVPYFTPGNISYPSTYVPNIKFTSREFDGLGRETRKINPDGTTYLTKEYDRWTTIFKNENGHRQDSIFDAFGRLAEKQEYTGADGRFPDYPAEIYTPYTKTVYNYNAEGNLLEVISDAGTGKKNISTTMQYDLLGRKTEMNDPDMGIWKYKYDLNGNLVEQTDAKQNVITFTYDELNRLETKTDSSLQVNSTYTYDNQTKQNAKGRLTEIVFPGGEKDFQYDNLGREIESTLTIDLSPFPIQTNYDALNNVTDIVYPDNFQLFYQYNDVGELKAISNDENLIGPQTFLKQKMEDGSEKREENEIVRKKKTFMEELWGVVNIFDIGEAEAQTTINYSSMTKEDPQSAITLTSSCIEFDNIETNKFASYVYKEYPVSGDFTHEFNTIVTAVDNIIIETPIWGISNTLDTYDDWNDGISLSWRKWSTSYFRLEFQVDGSGAVNSVNLNVNQRYYIRVTRTGTTATTQIYSDINRTVLVDTLITNFNTNTYNYLYGFSNNDSIHTNRHVTGDVCNLIDQSGSGGGSDTQAPTQPGSFSASNITTNSFQLNWNASTDNVAVTGYKLDIATDSNFANKVSGYNNKNITSGLTQTSVTGLGANQLYHIRLKAYDAAGNESTYAGATITTLSIPTENNPPILNAIGNKTITAGQTLSFSVSGSDPDNDAITYSVQNAPTGSSFDVNTGAFSWAPSSATTVNVTFLISDGSLSDTETITITVNASNPGGGGEQQDLTTFLTGNTSSLTIDTDCLAFSNIQTRNTDAYAYKNIGSVNDDTYELDFRLSSSNTFSGETLIWGLSDTAGTTFNNWNNGIYLGLYAGGTTSEINLRVGNVLNGVMQHLYISENISRNTRYYVRVVKNGQSVSVKLYSDSERLSEAYDFGTVTVGTPSVLPNLYAFSTRTLNSGAKRMTGDVCRLSFGDGGGNPPGDTVSPSVPGNFSASNATTNFFQLNWTSSTDNVGVTGYKLDVATDIGFVNKVAGYDNKDLSAVTTQTTVSGLTDNQLYYVRLKAYDAADNESNYATVTGQTIEASDTEVPTVPGNLTATNPTTDSFQLNWTSSIDNVGVTGYKLDVATDIGFVNKVAGYDNKDLSAVTTQTTVSGLTDNQLYYVRLKAYDAAGNESGYATVTGQTIEASDTEVPTVPGNLTATNSTTDSFQLNWTSSTDNVGVTGYKLDVATDNGFVNRVSGYNNKDFSSGITQTTVSGLSDNQLYHVRLKAYDAAGNESTYAGTTVTTLSIPTENNPPILNAIGNKSVDENTALTFTINASDADGDALIYSASNLPAGAVFNASTKTFTWTPTYSQAGNYATVTFTVSDGSLQDSEVITLTVNNVNRTPVLNSVGNKTITAGQTLSFSVSGSDPDNDAITYSVQNAPTGSSFDVITGAFSWIPSSATTENITFSVTDGNLSDSENITITVNASNPGGGGEQQDLTTFLTGNTSSLTIDTDCVAFTNIQTRNTDAYAYKNIGSVNDDTYELDFRLNSANSFSGETLIWGLSDTADETFNDWNNGIYLGLYRGGSNAEINLRVGHVLSGTMEHLHISDNISLNTRYYVRVVKNGQSVSVKLYSDPERLSEAYDFGTVTVGTPSVLPNLYAFSTRTLNSSSRRMTGDVCRLSFGDGGGNPSGDTVSPTVPGNFSASNATTNFFQLNWTSSTDNVGVTGYKLDVATDNEFVNKVSSYDEKDISSSSTQTTVAELSANQQYHIRLKAYDAAGNESGYAVTLISTDSEPPVLTSQLFIENIEYNAAGQITEIVYGNGTMTKKEYDDNLRLKRIHTYETQNTSNVIQDLNYTYDGIGNIRSINDAVNTASQTFVYDDLNRLEQAKNLNTYGTKDYNYDVLGNIVLKDGKTYAYEDLNKPHAVKSINDGGVITDFVYDPNGNMTHKGATTVYNYDIENRLTSVEINTATTGSYVYDESGQRIKKTANGVTTKFVGGLYESTGTANTKHLFAAGMRVATIENNAPVYYHADHLGSANVLTDDTGNQVDVMEYEPFGELSRHDITENQEEGYLYTDQYRDDESELYYYNARYYNPSIGRFITPDWIVPGVSNPQAFNRYTYVFNNPINFIDPSGNKPGTQNGFNEFTIGTTENDFNLSTVTPESSSDSYDLLPSLPSYTGLSSFVDFNNIVMIDVFTEIVTNAYFNTAGVKTHQQVLVDTANGKITNENNFIGKTHGIQGLGSLSASIEEKTNDSLTISLEGEAQTAVRFFPKINYDIDVSLTLDPNTNNVTSVDLSGSHDGFPTYFMLYNGIEIYRAQEGHIGQLLGTSDVRIP